MTAEEIRSSLTVVPKGWDQLLQNEIQKDYYQKLVADITQKYLTEKVYPPYKQVFSAFELTSLDDIKVVTKRAPSDEEMRQLLFAWKVAWKWLVFCSSRRACDY